MKSTLLILALTLGLIDFHCKDVKVNDTDGANNIVGKWNWIKSCGGIGGGCHTPESTGNKIVIEFTKDSIFRKYKNDTLLIQNPFKITRGKTIFSQDSAQLIKIKDMLVQSFSFSANDTLFLNEECYDCYGSKYVKIK